MKKFFPFCCSILSLIILGISNEPRVSNTVDLRGAYQIASIEAMKWNKAAEPYFITSVDDGIDSEFVKGEDGKRHYWNFDFVVKNTNKHLIITVRGKAIVNKLETESSVDNDHIIDIERLNISTVEAALIARETYGLLPGTDWAQGYHFVLENDGMALVLAVVGLNDNGAMSRVFFNAETGEVIMGNVDSAD